MSGKPSKMKTERKFAPKLKTTVKTEGGNKQVDLTKNTKKRLKKEIERGFNRPQVKTEYKATITPLGVRLGGPSRPSTGGTSSVSSSSTSYSGSGGAGKKDEVLTFSGPSITALRDNELGAKSLRRMSDYPPIIHPFMEQEIDNDINMNEDMDDEDANKEDEDSDDNSDDNMKAEPKISLISNAAEEMDEDDNDDDDEDDDNDYGGKAKSDSKTKSQKKNSKKQYHKEEMKKLRNARKMSLPSFLRRKSESNSMLFMQLPSHLPITPQVAREQVEKQRLSVEVKSEHNSNSTQSSSSPLSSSTTPSSMPPSMTTNTDVNLVAAAKQAAEQN